MADRYPIFDNEAVHASLPQDAAPVVVVCEHASNAMPSEFGGLGLDRAARESHVAWDPGALPVARAIATSLHAPLIAGAASRLLFDCNRPPEAVDAMPPHSEVFEIPGNQNLSDAARAERVRRFHDPFNAAMVKLLDAQVPQLMITMHSFTATYNSQPREVEIGVLHDDDSRFADALLACAADHTAHVVRRNDPYGPEHGVTHTLKKHALPRGIHNVMIEVRNDLIATADQQAAMATMMDIWLRTAMVACDIPQEGGAQCPA
ncbi:N-formylglutamate amidohydrolase [Thalassobius sp. Cn5-15]|uniref:N-formylglutamate amidohydrolase n=1 Tax=Thalassobius sp. Cn5-15 TaxID=2917763 RepID=UPI001EF30FD9|nr:N-formylglutamate amidohydrolase [Thalassobius sp. Cn5-15]MCG7494074.1 N-formylglutamate amidohydrolase [Thalassobius sp. Cn5-15]